MTVASLPLLIGVAIAFMAYWIPTYVAWARSHRTAQVAIINAFLGWTFLGWVAALVMAAGPQARR